MNSYILYLFNEKESAKNILNNEYSITIFRPQIFSLKMHEGRMFIYLFWYFFTLGNYQIFYVYHNRKIIHYTHSLPRFFKFPFMGVNDLQIGPCWTDVNYRGLGIYPSVIDYVINKTKSDRYYMMTTDNNYSSQKGIVKAGFKQISFVRKSRFLGRYILVK